MQNIKKSRLVYIRLVKKNPSVDIWVPEMPFPKKIIIGAAIELAGPSDVIVS